MRVTDGHRDSRFREEASAGAAWVGIVAFLFVAVGGLVRHRVDDDGGRGRSAVLDRGDAGAACEADELEEEGLTLAECRQMALRVHDIALSAPAWFPRFHADASAAGTGLALFSLLAAAALVDRRPWSRPAAIAAFVALAAIDAAAFAAVVNSGPIVRQMYTEYETFGLIGEDPSAAGISRFEGFGDTRFLGSPRAVYLGISLEL